MAETFYTILTNVGQAKIANAQVTGDAVEFLQLAVGDGNGSYYNPTASQTSLKKEVWRGNISQVSIDPDNPNWIVIETVLMASVGGFTVREAGVYDADGDMIAVGKFPETYKPILDSGSAKDLYIRIILEVSNASSVTLKIDPSAIFATREYVNQRVDAITHDYVRQPAFASTGGTAGAYTVTLDPVPTSLVEGFGITIVPHIANAANPTLNINGLGAIALKDQKGIAYTSGKLQLGKPYTFRKVGADFLADSGGGATGDATAGDIRAGKTATVGEGEITGTLPVRGGGAFTPSKVDQSLPTGIYDNPIVVQGSANLVASNIKQGIDMFGVVGNFQNYASRFSVRIPAAGSVNYNADWGIIMAASANGNEGQIMAGVVIARRELGGLGTVVYPGDNYFALFNADNASFELSGTADRKSFFIRNKSGVSSLYDVAHIKF